MRPLMRPARLAQSLRPIHPLSPTTLRLVSATRLYSTPPPPPPPQQQPTSPSPSPSPTPTHSTVDPTEVSHFTTLASSWWDPHGPSRLLHLMNPLRHGFISRCLASSAPTTSTSTPPTNRILDVGCGGGIFAESAARLPTTSSVLAIDPTPSVLAIAQSHARRDPSLAGKLVYANTAIESLPLPSSPSAGYDIVTCFEVLEHVSAPGPFLEKLMPHVRPGGWLVMSTIARTWTSWVVTNVVAEDVLGIVPKGTHEWGKYVNEGELRGWFEGKEGWGEVKCQGVVYVPGLGWKEVGGSEGWGNYFFAVRRLPVSD